MNRVRMTGLMVIAMLIAAFAVAGTASAKDRNKDGLPDRWEKHYDLSLKVDQAKRDQDRDGLNNKGEFRSDSNPRSDDTDNDGVEDGEENAGVISSFDGTTLTIDLFGGGTVTGTVDENTEVKCGSEGNDNGDDPAAPAPPVGAQRDDNSGPGSENSGPGNEGEDDPADDDQGEDDPACSIDDLAVDVTVHQAEIEVSNGSARFDEIELAE